MKKLLTYTLVVIGLSGCSAFSLSDNADFAPVNGFAGFNETVNLKDEMRYKRNNVKTLGVLTIADFSKSAQDRDPMVFLIKREKSKISAVTSLYQSENKEKTFFDETILDIALDKKNKGLSMELTLKF
jgi:hypothetical protein